MSCKLHGFEESCDKSRSLHGRGSLEKWVILCTNTSDVAIDAIKMQEDMVIAYESRKSKQCIVVHELELLTKIHELEVLSHYLLGGEFKIRIDKQSL